MTTAAIAGDGKDITLRDVIIHMQHMEQRLSAAIAGNTAAIAGNAKDIRSLNGRLDVLEENLTHRIDTLEEDLHVTIKDMLGIRRHVGMGIPEDD
jgi:hypothetical protein